MAEYHVGAGLFGIYAGVLKNKEEWKGKTECTDKALEAVRDFMCDEFIKCGKTSGGYEWTKKDGSVVTLQVSLKENHE